MSCNGRNLYAGHDIYVIIKNYSEINLRDSFNDFLINISSFVEMRSKSFKVTQSSTNKINFLSYCVEFFLFLGSRVEVTCYKKYY